MADGDTESGTGTGNGSVGGATALITGAASGIGLATAELLAERGANLVLCDLDADGGSEVAERLGGRFVEVDVSDLEQNRAAVEVALEQFGGLDLAFLNAGISTGCGLGEDFDLELYRRAMGANLDGVAFGIHACLPALRDGGGSIVATASLAGLTAVPLDPIYAANKHAVVGMVRSLEPGLAADGVRINAICPGFADTKIIGLFKSELEAAGMPIIPARDVAAAALALFEGEMSGECWFIQPGREPQPFRFPNLPGPRT